MADAASFSHDEPPVGSRCLAGLSQPALLDIPLCETDQTDDAACATSFGCNQDWYGEHWQRQAGCGPCTSSTLLLYLARSRPDLADLYPQPSAHYSHFVSFMHQIWHYVTPGRMGVNEAAMLADGVSRFAAARQVMLQSTVFEIPAIAANRLPISAFRDFIVTGLSLDSPVAFLNLSNGRLKNLDSWHWVTLTALYQTAEDELLAEISDSGEQKFIGLSLWYRTTRLGGAAVYFQPADPAAVQAAGQPASPHYG